ncbi:MAG: FAD-dependent thymidylate synthase, partial [Crenarchaeota archaeon]|nr:FAD-dependent thymidylate synthase [Thermoproteota archaeon]
MARARLIALSIPVIGGDPRRLVVLAAKVSQGKLHERSHEHYLTAYSSERVGEWLAKAVQGFPSVLEHVTFTFLIEGISRVCSHQLVRHRI